MRDFRAGYLQDHAVQDGAPGDVGAVVGEDVAEQDSEHQAQEGNEGVVVQGFEEHKSEEDA